MIKLTQKHKILIVDDVPGNIKTLLEVLGDIYEIFVATNGNDALKIAAAHPP